MKKMHQIQQQGAKLLTGTAPLGSTPLQLLPDSALYSVELWPRTHNLILKPGKRVGIGTFLY